MFCWEPEGSYCHIYVFCTAIASFWFYRQRNEQNSEHDEVDSDVLLRTRRELSPYALYSNSILPVLYMLMERLTNLWTWQRRFRAGGTCEWRGWGWSKKGRWPPLRTATASPEMYRKIHRCRGSESCTCHVTGKESQNWVTGAIFRSWYGCKVLHFKNHTCMLLESFSYLNWKFL